MGNDSVGARVFQSMAKFRRFLGWVFSLEVMVFHSAVCSPTNLFLWPGAGASLFWHSYWSSVVRACVSVKKIQIACPWPTVHVRSSLFAVLVSILRSVNDHLQCYPGFSRHDHHRGTSSLIPMRDSIASMSMG